jgi:hypothetical protein
MTLFLAACDNRPVDVASSASALTSNWNPCTHDSDCQSNWCGCNGGSSRVCLPSTAYPKACANWVACTHDSDCVSSWCGCNGGSTRECLPSTAYPKACANWVYCDHDSDCQSNWCGCNGGSNRACLPSTVYPKACTNWNYCDHDSECLSGWCGCNGGDIKQCLPNTAYPKDCANWVYCDHDNECQSSWCGCNGGSTRECLPSTAYPKACPNWTLCDADGDCQSSWCGCNGGSTSECLPSTAYPKTCEDLTLWPNSVSKANSDTWLTVNHRNIRSMSPRILAINFANGTGSQANTPTTFSDMVSLVSNQSCNGTPCSVIDGLRMSSKYHGYSDPNAPAFLNPVLAYAVDLSDKGHPPAGWYHNNSSLYPLKCNNSDGHQFNFAALFSSTFAGYFNIRDAHGNLLTLAQAIQQGLVHEVYLHINGNDWLPDQFNACTVDANCASGRVCRGGYCRTSDAYQCPNGGPHMNDFQLPEVLEWKQLYNADGQKLPGFDPAAGNGQFDNDELAALQPIGRSIRFTYVNSTRGPGCPLHSLGHAREHSTYKALPALAAEFTHFANFDLNQRGFSPNPPFANFYGLNCPPGQTCLTWNSSNSLSWFFAPNGERGTFNPYSQGCGSVHFAPNGRQDYDDTNSFAVLSTCESYGLHNGPGGKDAQALISAAAWSTPNAAQHVTYNDVAPDCEGGWQIYWSQSFPGYHNTASGHTASGTSNGVPIKSWWPYLYE